MLQSSSSPPSSLASSLKLSKRLISLAFLLCLVATAVINFRYLNDVTSGRALTRPANEGHQPPSTNSTRNKKENNTATENISFYPPIAGLSCESFGLTPVDPSTIKEMIYWNDIPSDATFISPYRYNKSFKKTKRKYLTFEPDIGGWNNRRMSMETAIVLAHVMGRILVLPPKQAMYLLRAYPTALSKQKQHKKQKQQSSNHDYDSKYTNELSFDDMVPLYALAEEHAAGFTMMSMEEFLKREGRTGRLRNKHTGEIEYPPYDNRTNWDGVERQERNRLWNYLRNVTTTPMWKTNECIVAIPDKSKNQRLPNKLNPLSNATERMELYWTTQMKMDNSNGDNNEDSKRRSSKEKSSMKKYFAAEYDGNPTAVNAPPTLRLREMRSHRRKVCVYTDELQRAKVLHFVGDESLNTRLLSHFYTYLFFEDYHHDLWVKRFVRDHLRYKDEIQCAAARIIMALRVKARRNNNNSNMNNSNYDAFHIRRGDFQYKETRISAEQILANSQDVIQPNGIVYIATDERDKSFFSPFQNAGYDVYFLGNFSDELRGINKNFYGMIDQLVASRSRVFVGSYFSTFTGYINRLRGYHTENWQRVMRRQQQQQQQGKSTAIKMTTSNTSKYKMGDEVEEDAGLNSYHYMPMKNKYELRKYKALHPPLWAREFPIAWRDIDYDIPLDAIISHP